MIKNLRSHRTTATVCPSPSDVDDRFVTIQGQAYSPADMQRALGRTSITVENVSKLSASAGVSEEMFDDGCVSPELPFEEQRGINLVDAWNRSEDSKKRILNAKRTHQEFYNE